MSVLIFAEQKQGKVGKAVYGAIAAGARVAGLLGVPYHVLVLGPDAPAAASLVSKRGAAKVLVGEHAALDPYLDEMYASALHQAAKAVGATVVMGLATSQGKAILPCLAALWDAGMASEVTGITDSLTFLRPIYAGNANAEVEITAANKVLSLRGTSFAPAPEVDTASPIEALTLTLDPGTLRKRFVSFDAVVSARPPLTEAAVVVSAGRGIKSAENLPLIEGLADLLGAAVGASRAVVDAGWMPNDYQVGQTGKVVAPNLYVAVGLSGAIQHLAGMKDSKVIVAINKDEEAPIFSVADYGLVADLFVAVPELTTKIKQLKGL